MDRRYIHKRRRKKTCAPSDEVRLSSLLGHPIGPPIAVGSDVLHPKDTILQEVDVLLHAIPLSIEPRLRFVGRLSRNEGTVLVIDFSEDVCPGAEATTGADIERLMETDMPRQLLVLRREN